MAAVAMDEVVLDPEVTVAGERAHALSRRARADGRRPLGPHPTPASLDAADRAREDDRSTAERPFPTGEEVRVAFTHTRVTRANGSSRIVREHPLDERTGVVASEHGVEVSTIDRDVAATHEIKG